MGVVGRKALAWLLLLAPAILGGAEQSVSGRLEVQVGPEAALSLEGGSQILVKIRLANGSTAQLAQQDDCSGAVSNSTPIAKSGVFRFAVAPSSQYACLYTAEKTVALRLAPAGEGK